MGAHLSEPVREKEIEDVTEGNISVGVASMQGWRNSMEDAHVFDLKVGGTEAKLFAVFDGHGGREVAMFAARELSNTLASLPEFQKGDYGEAMRLAFLKIDEKIQTPAGADWLRSNRDREPRPITQELKNIEEQIGVKVSKLMQKAQDEDGNAGCTAVAVLLVGDTYYIANAGDSRASLCRGGSTIELTLDHGPELQSEIDRIEKAGGMIERGRVMGNLNLTRALGDLTYKTNTAIPPEEQIITANPEIYTQQVHEDDEFLIIACDGIWEARTSAQVQQYLKKKIDTLGDKPLSGVAGDLCDVLCSPNVHLTDGIGCDNMTVMIVDLMKSRRDAQGAPPKPTMEHKAVQLNAAVGKDGSPLTTDAISDLSDVPASEIPAGA